MWSLEELVKHSTTVRAELEKGVWVPARPEGSRSLGCRIRYAWMVFKGEADAVVWPKGQ